MHKKLLLFGTGKISKRYTEILQQLSIDVFGYIDNNADKQGKLFFNKRIYAPSKLKEIKNSEIIIACSDVKAITDQLCRMGLQNEIVTIHYIIKREIEKIAIEERERNYPVSDGCEKKTIIIDNLEGTWGGAEDWAHKLALELVKQGYKVLVIESMSSTIIEGLEQFTIRIDREDKTLLEGYTELAELLLQSRPFTLFNMWGTEVLWASAFVKKIYPDDVQIITSVLNDNDNLYHRQCEWDEYIDMYLCISSKIKSSLTNLYDIDEEKVLYREPFVENIRKIKKEYCLNNKYPLKIGYPCRLTRSQKRADLLPELIEKLESKGVNYVLDIAGNGDCEEKIRKYVEDNELHDKINFYGKLSKEKLINFLEKQDVYLNFSEFEGTSLTMLEAMAGGCVPVVTDVSGVNDFIINMENGMISEVGDMENIANNILFLDKNRQKIKDYGEKCMNIIACKCNINQYIEYIRKLIV